MASRYSKAKLLNKPSQNEDSTMTIKQNLYQILGVPPDADHSAIEKAFQAKDQLYQAGLHGQSPDEASLKRKILLQAYTTIINPVERAAYDAKLIARTQGSAEILPEFPSAMMPLPEKKSGRTGGLKPILMMIGSMMAIGLVIQLGFMFSAYRANHDMNYAVSAGTTQQEMVILREFYQSTGQQPRSIAEMHEMQRQLDMQAEASRAQYQQQAKQEAYQRELEKSSRVGQEVSTRLRRAEEEARLAEEEKQRQVQEQEKARKQAEEERIAREKNKWNAVLQGGNYNSSNNSSDE